MQNDVLYNQVMKKILVIEIGTDENMDPVITGANMKPSEVMQPGMLPIFAFMHIYIEGVFDDYGLSGQFGYENGDFTIHGVFNDIIADTVNDEWIFAS